MYKKRKKIELGEIFPFEEAEQVAMGIRICDAREEAGMTQQNLADMLGFENKNQVSRIERGVTPCKTKYLYEISQMFGLSLDYLFFGDEQKNNLREIMDLCKNKNEAELKKAAEILKVLFE